MKCKVGDKLRSGCKVTLTSNWSGVPKNSLGKVVQWTYERYLNGIFYTRHIVVFNIKNKEVTVSIPTKLLKK